MPLFERRRPVSRRARSLTAAGERVAQADSSKLRRLIQPWQHRALAFYETVGEVNFSAQFYARTLSKIRFFAAELDENGDPQESENPELIELWDRVQDPGGGRTNLMTAYGQLKFLCGDCYLVCTGDADEPTGEKWEILSVAELRSTDKGRYQRVIAPGLGFEDLISAPDDAFEPMPGEVAVYRLYTPDPRWRRLADAPMRGVLGHCEQLVLLDLAVRARAKSRAAGPGVLLVSDAMSLPRIDGDGNDDDIMADPVFGPLIRSLMAPLSDPGSASAVVPHIMTVPEQLDIDKVMKLIKFSDPNEEYREQQQRDATVTAFATGVDFPIEILKGMTDANHWSGWLVDEQSWKAHLMPVTQRCCDDFNSAYLRPAAREAGVANWEKVAIGYDAAEVINHPDRAKDAFQAYQGRAVSKDYVRRAIGATDDDAMPDDELNEAIGVAVRDASMAKYGIPSIKAGGIEPEPGEVENPTGTESEPVGATDGADIEKGPPPGGVPEPRTASAARLGSFEVARLVGLAEGHLDRAREVAGNRLRNRSRGCQHCQELIRDQPPSLVAAMLGEDQTRLVLGAEASERQLVAGAGETFARAAERLGVPARWAVDLGELVESHAARTLYEKQPAELPAHFAVLAGRALSHPLEQVA